MISMFESSRVIEVFGWTLLNSIWQALAFYLVVALLLRFVSLRASNLRYAIACGAMMSFVLSNIGFFVYAIGTSTSEVGARTSSGVTLVFNEIIANDSTTSWLAKLFSLMSSNMEWILLGWTIGTTLFLMRMVAGWWYINRLRAEASIVDQLCKHVATLANEFGVIKNILVAESAGIKTPMVIGFVKPIILVPSGIISGLTYDELEAVFVHELAHIKRHDYLVNLAQSIIESIFFFNPFVWMMSNIIRREREYCCDDTVVSRRTSLVYAKALARLEEIRLSVPNLAVALAEDKNQLLNRIKRIMEKTTRNQGGVEKLVPVVLLVVGLVCASWLTINSNDRVDGDQQRNATVSDTTKKKMRSGSYSKSSTITYDKDGNPHEEVVEEYSDDEDLKPFLAPGDAVAPADIDVLFNMPPVPEGFADVEMFEDPLPPAVLFDLYFDNDTVPPGRFSGDEWKAFGEAFEKKFQEQFGDFYKSNEKEFEKMMKELETQFEKSFKDEDFGRLRVMELGDQREMMAKMEEMQARISKDMRDKMYNAQEDVRRQMENVRQQQMDNLQVMELKMENQSEDMKRMERKMRLMEDNMRQFEKELKSELVKDGYLKKDESIHSLRMEDEAGSMKVNGIKIKAEHEAKYRELHRKYVETGTGRSE